MNGTVYFLQVQPDGPVKIGFTSQHVNIRVCSLQASSPYVLKWIGYFVGTHADEQAAHTRLAKHRIRAEWFRPEPEVLAFVREKCPVFDEAEYLRNIFCEEDRSLVRRLDRDGRQDVASHIGVPFFRIIEWLSGARVLECEKAVKAGAFARAYLASPEHV